MLVSRPQDWGVTVVGNEPYNNITGSDSSFINVVSFHVLT